MIATVEKSMKKCGMHKAGKLNGNKKHLNLPIKLMCNYWVDQHLIVLNLWFSILINKILATELVIVNVSQNLNPMQNLTLWNQQLSSKCFEK